jgi:hypothetical protein
VSAAQDITVFPGAASLAIAGLAPGVTTGSAVVPIGTASLTVTGMAPSLFLFTPGRVIAVGPGVRVIEVGPRSNVRTVPV